ncbi:restriction endonuclease subunit S [Bacillus cereus]|uniref:restriction endonuclease subunit S n=1 Tax=Bacillus cereus TaxID=1396 RepID=UPI0010BECE95|nr:restriction endonuclease subunit S [Bacillus cereus]TKH47377.1 restriction endonuclease subunit S [Bacillus cereus]
MVNFKTYEFNKLYEMSSGISTTPEQAGHGAPFVSFSTIFNNYFLPEELPDLMAVSKKDEETYSVRKGDIFLTRTSETLDELAMSSVAIKDYPRATYSGFAKRLRPLQDDITYDKFMGFYLRSPYFRKSINYKTTMTLRASFNEDTFSFLDLYLPDYLTQVKIGDLLYKLEEKRQLNEKINRDLESLIKIIYNYWFIQFEFPDENGNPYKSSGGKMEWNEELKKEIPVGWGNGCLGDLVENVSNSTSSGDHLKGMRYTPIEELPKRKMTFRGGLDYSEANSSLILYKKYDILLGAMRVYFHRVCIAPFNGITRTTTMVLRAKNLKQLPFIYETIFDDATIQFATTHSVGTQQPYVEWAGTLENCKIVIPQADIIDKFCEKVNSMIEVVIKRELENNELISLRDWLLPMLMNGQVTFR